MIGNLVHFLSTMSTKINVQQNIQANIQRIMQTRVDACRQALQLDNPHKAIHQSRKEMKKIRAVLRLIRPQLEEEEYQAANTYFRDAARIISDARDVTASAETVGKLQSSLTSARDRRALAQLKRHFWAKKAAITRYQVRRDQLLLSVQDALEDAERLYRSWTITEDGFAALAPGIKRIYRQCLKRRQVAYDENTPHGYHQWRKSVKYLRYQVDTLSPLWPGPLGALETELNKLTDYLGDDHDLFVLRQMIEQGEVMRPETTRSVIKTMEERRGVLQQSARGLSQKLFYQKPKQFVKPLAYWWEVEEKEVGEILLA